MNMPLANVQSNHAGSIPVSYTGWVARALELSSSELPSLLENSGLAPECLTDESTLLSPAQQGIILANATRLSGDNEFSLRLGQLLTPASHGPIGYLVLSSPDLQTAIEGFVQFFPTRIPFLRLDIEIREDKLIAHVDVSEGFNSEDYRHFMEAFVVSLQSIVEYILGRPLTEASGEFGYANPDIDYNRYLHFPVSFDAATTRFLIPLALAQTANISSNHESYAFALRQCQQQLASLQKPQTTSQKVRALMLSHPVRHLSEEQVAAELFICKRTLARRLKAENSSFRQLRDQHLGTLAKSYLDNHELSVEAIALLLDFHDTANFRRAFKRWFEMTPQDYRRRF
jgi:AraC-like DNA-binding protein